MSDYDTDLLAWTERQAALLRRMGAGDRVNDLVDWDNVAEEIEASGRSDRRELHSRIGTVLEHLIKLRASAATEPGAGWRQTVRRERRGISRLLKDSPSLKPLVHAIILEELPGAIEDATAALQSHGEPVLSPDLAFSEDQVLGPWLPD